MIGISLYDICTGSESHVIIGVPFCREKGVDMKKGDKIAIVACSNGMDTGFQQNLEALQKILLEMGLVSVYSDYIYAQDQCFSGSAPERAAALMKFYQEEDIKGIFDISGGDLANEILPYLDYDVIARSEKLFWGYSDLTTLINAIYAKTGKSSILYQIRNFIYDQGEKQIRDFRNTVMKGENDLFQFRYSFVQGHTMSGVAAGGNIRCLLKLAGTEYWPDLDGKILLLESNSGRVPQMVTLLNQLKQMHVFDQISGILLGTFTQMEREKCDPNIVELVKRYAGSRLPIAKTEEIGHGTDSKGIVIGQKIDL